MVKMMLSQSRHVFKAVMSSMVDSTKSPSFTFGTRIRSTLNLGVSDNFRAFPFFSSNCSGDVAQIDGEVLLLRFLERLKNYEKEGVPTGAGTDSIAGFDLQRMERLLVRLGNPLSSYPVEFFSRQIGPKLNVTCNNNVRGFQCTRECVVCIQYAKTYDGSSYIDR